MKRRRRFADGSKESPGTSELAPFRKRLGDTPEKLLEWIVSFAQRDLAQIGPGECQDLGQDLRVLPSLVWKKEVITLLARRPMPREALVESQTTILDGLKRFIGGGWWVDGLVGLGLVKNPKSGRPRTVVSYSGPSNVSDGGVLASVASLLCQGGPADRLRTCPARGCGRIFLRHGKQTFCSLKHAQQARNDRFYLKRKAKELGREPDRVRVRHPRKKGRL